MALQVGEEWAMRPLLGVEDTAEIKKDKITRKIIKTIGLQYMRGCDLYCVLPTKKEPSFLTFKPQESQTFLFKFKSNSVSYECCAA